MDWNAVNYQINDVPSTFKRTGATYQWLVNSLTAALHRYTNADDGVDAQTTFTAATSKWLDTWGLLFGMPRNAYESDGSYLNRMLKMLNIGGGTPVEIEDFTEIAFSLSTTVGENLLDASGAWLLTPSWSLTMNTTFQASQYQELTKSLGVVRPAGIPFTFSVASGGLILGTLNYLGGYRVTGDYLGSSKNVVLPVLSASTNNSVPLLPTLWLTDPLVNPSLPTPAAPVFVQPTSNVPFGSDAYTNFTIVSADPNGTLAGAISDKAFDAANRVLYVCSTGGTASTAVWTPVNAAIAP